MFFSVITSILCISMMDLMFLYLTYFRIIFWYLWILGKCFSINRTKYLPIFLGRVFWKRRFEQDNGSFAIFGRLTFVFIFVIWWFVLRFAVKLRLIQDILIVFRCLIEISEFLERLNNLAVIDISSCLRIFWGWYRMDIKCFIVRFAKWFVRASV